MKIAKRNSGNEPIVVFLNGLSGAGKSEIVRYLKKNPIGGWTFYDFDSDGPEKCPDGTGEEKHKWREQQTNWFFWRANRNAQEKGLNTAIFGFMLFPKSTLALEGSRLFKGANIHFALIDCEHEERKNRLISRGTPNHWHGVKDWYPEYYREMEEDGEQRFDNTSKTVEQTAKEIASWLEKL